jgi:hypothetical protein
MWIAWIIFDAMPRESQSGHGVQLAQLRDDAQEAQEAQEAPYSSLVMMLGRMCKDAKESPQKACKLSVGVMFTAACL